MASCSRIFHRSVRHDQILYGSYPVFGDGRLRNGEDTIDDLSEASSRLELAVHVHSPKVSA